MKKKILLSLLIISILTTILPATNIFAGGYAAILYIKWVEYQADLKTTSIILSDENLMNSEKPEVIIPDGTKRASEYTHYTDQENSKGYVKEWINDNIYLKHLYLAFDEKNNCLQAGKYKLTPDFIIPEGYEYDDTFRTRDDLSVTITQKEVDEYWQMVSQPGGGTMYWVIEIPVKEAGKTSKALAKPPVPRLHAEEATAYVAIDYKAPDFESYEIQYSTKSNSGFKTCSTSNYVRYGSVKAFQHGKTYYFRARTVREIAGKKYYSKWTSVKKAKVNKVGQYNKLSLWLDAPFRYQTDLFLQDKLKNRLRNKWKIIYKYSTKKNGTYKTIKGTYQSPCKVETLQEKAGMKKGKTYYLKGIVKVPCEDGTYVTVVTSALKYVGK